MRCPISSRNPIRNGVSAVLAAVGLKSRAPRINPMVVGREVLKCATQEGASARVSFLTAGSSTQVRIILIHGSPGSAAVWSRYLNTPQADIEYISIDRAGYGGSTEGDHQTSLQHQTDLLSHLLAIDKVNLVVGHSYGGAVAAHLAASYPNRVHGLMLVSAALDPNLEKILLIQRLAEKAPLRWFIPNTLRVSNRELMHLKGELDQLAPMLGNIQSDVHIIHGTRDALVPVSNTDYMAERLTSCASLEITRLPGRNHFIPWNAYEVINSAMVDMARRLLCHR